MQLIYCVNVWSDKESGERGRATCGQTEQQKCINNIVKFGKSQVWDGKKLAWVIAAAFLIQRDTTTIAAATAAAAVKEVRHRGIAHVYGEHNRKDDRQPVLYRNQDQQRISKTATTTIGMQKSVEAIHMFVFTTVEHVLERNSKWRDTGGEVEVSQRMEVSPRDETLCLAKEGSLSPILQTPASPTSTSCRLFK